MSRVASRPQTSEVPASVQARVTRGLREWIRTGRLGPGEPLPAERTLAQRFNVSRDTIRAALKCLDDEGLTRNGPGRHRRRVQSSRPAAGLLGDSVALLTTEGPIRDNIPFGYDAYIEYHVLNLLAQRDLHALRLNPRLLRGENATQLTVSRPRAVVVTYNVAESEGGRQLAQSCQDNGIPTVVYGDGPGLENFDRVSSDHQDGAYRLTRHLIDRGCQRILRFWRFSAEHHWLDMRNVGYERALTEHKLPILPAVRTPELPKINDQTGFEHLARMLAGYLVEHVLGPTPIDAIMVASDGHALQVAAALRLLGKRPNQDVLIVGYDNLIDVSLEKQWESSRPVATIDKRNGQIAEQLMGLIFERLENKTSKGPQRRLVQPQMVLLDDQSIPR